MKTIHIHDAKNHSSKLVVRSHSGEGIIISKVGKLPEASSGAEDVSKWILNKTQAFPDGRFIEDSQ